MQSAEAVANVANAGCATSAGQAVWIVAKSTDLVADHTSRMPSMKPKSPMRLQMNALLAAAGGAGLLYQWPMRM